MSYSYEGLSIEKNEIILVIFKCSILVSLNYWLGLILKSLLKSLGKNAYNADICLFTKSLQCTVQVFLLLPGIIECVTHVHNEM